MSFEQSTKSKLDILNTSSEYIFLWSLNMYLSSLRVE